MLISLCDGAEVHLTPNEYRLLATLIRHAGKVCTHRQLLSEVWGPSHVEHAHYVRIYMAQLRHKLELDPTNPRYLRTEVGGGLPIACGVIRPLRDERHDVLPGRKLA